MNEVHPRERALWRSGAIAGDPIDAFRYEVWGTADAYGLHANSESLVNLDDDFKSRYFKLQIRRTFIYGEHTAPKRPEEATADALTRAIE